MSLNLQHIAGGTWQHGKRSYLGHIYDNESNVTALIHIQNEEANLCPLLNMKNFIMGRKL
jgi:hypothetical protein